MPRNNLQNNETIRVGGGRVEFQDPDTNAWVNIGLYTGLTVNFPNITNQIIADNGETAPRSRSNGGNITFTMLEVALDNLQRLIGIYRYSTTAGNQQTATDKAVTGTWTANTPIALPDANGDGTAITVSQIQVDGNTIAAQDYSIFAQNGQTFVLPENTVSGAITYSGTYTPNATKNLTGDNQFRDLVTVPVRFVHTVNNKDFTVLLHRAYSSDDIALGFAANTATDAGSTTPLTLTALADDNGDYWTVTDAQDTSPSKA